MYADRLGATRGATAVLALLVACAPTTALADEAIRHDPAAADALFQRGKRLWAEGAFAAACRDFEASMAADPSVSTEIKIARCRTQQGKVASAFAAYEHASELCLSSKLPKARSTALLAEIKAEIDPLAARMPWLRIDVDRRTLGLVVRRNGERVPLGALGEAQRVDPGQVVVDARAPGYEPAEVRLALREGQHAAVDLELRPLPDPAEIARARARATRRLVGLEMAGVGLAAVAAGGVLGLHTLHVVSESNGFCTPDDACEPRGIALRSAARGAQTAGIVTAAIGAALLAGGALLSIVR